jgi:hypothetical protein
MTDFRKLLLLKDYMASLSDGIDPISGISIAGDSILNNKHLQSCFGEVADILENLILLGAPKDKIDRRYKYPFELSREDEKKIELSSSPIAISEFVHQINSVVDTTYIKKLKATQVTNWLTSEGYLEDIFVDEEFSFRRATSKGDSIGIQPVPKANSYGKEYVVNMYSAAAQQFILNNLNMIVMLSEQK